MMNRSAVLLCLVVGCFATLYEGDRCMLPFNEEGRCVRLSECPSAIHLVRSRQHPKTCSFIRSIPIVCCSLAVPFNPRLSERKCQIYKQLSTTTTTPPTIVGGDRSFEDLTKRPELFLVGGKNSLDKEFPHMAALGYSDGGEKKWLCGGSLISEKFILTAAHCLISQEYGPLRWARLGTLFLSPSTVDYPITNLIPHPMFRSPSRYHDIGLAEISRPLDLSPSIQPACLPANQWEGVASLTATGWGLTEFGGRQSDVLQKVDLEVFSEGECEESYRDLEGSRRLREGIIHERMFCAGGRKEEKDTCQGDSGGPLQLQNDGVYTIIGITSFGKSCGIKNIPGVYTKVAPYVAWIESIVWPDDF